MSERGVLGSVEAYSIVWIVSHQHELTAASAVLDERHHEPHDFAAQKHALDRLSYAWGNVGRHCVVIVSLPGADYQYTNIEIVVHCLRASLPHVRFGLVIGTGSGLPGERINRSGESVARRDIRLGDVVVGSPGPNATRGGAVQLDLDVTDGQVSSKQRVDIPPPPAALRSALMSLQSEFELDGNKIPEIIDSALLCFPNLQKSYGNPGVKKDSTSDSESDSEDEPSFTPDRLFKASYNHVGGKTCGKCESSGELKHKKREVPGPKVYVGATVLLKTAVKTADMRDKIVELLKKEDIDPMCFDTDNFGLPTGFPSLLIKGICDYSDDHRYGRWQKFAALSAAAFARELLGFVSVTDVERLPRIRELLTQA